MQKASPEEIFQYIISATAELYMKFSPKQSIYYQIGDVVDCNYGKHSDKEISGGHVNSIVCDIAEDGTAYVVPITKYENLKSGVWAIAINPEKDVFYHSDRFSSGACVLVTKGQYVDPIRFHEVLGYVSSDFLNKLLEKVSYAHNFLKTNLTTHHQEKKEEEFDENIFDTCELPEIEQPNPKKERNAK